MDIYPALTATLNWRSWLPSLLAGIFKRVPFLADETAFWVGHIQRPYLTPRFRLIFDRTPEIWDVKGDAR